MKSRRFQHAYRKSASKRHKEVGEILRNEVPWSGWTAYQEYPVNRVNPDFESGAERFDWYVKEISLVIECHGRQHFEPVAFGAEDATKTIERFKEQQRRDERKKEAAFDAGALYVAIRFNEKVTSDILYEKYKAALEVRNAYQENFQQTEPEPRGESEDLPEADQKLQRRKRPWPTRAKGSDPEFERARKERARTWRRERYKRQKEWLKARKEE